MSGCECGTPNLRVTGEVFDTAHEAVGTGQKSVRVRCETCGGKVGRVGSDLLTDLFGIDGEHITTGRCLDPDERPTLTVDLI